MAGNSGSLCATGMGTGTGGRPVHPCPRSAFCRPSADTHRQRDRRAAPSPEASLDWGVGVGGVSPHPGTWVHGQGTPGLPPTGFFHPAEEMLTGMEFVSLCFYPPCQEAAGARQEFGLARAGLYFRGDARMTSPRETMGCCLVPRAAGQGCYPHPAVGKLRHQLPGPPPPWDAPVGSVRALAAAQPPREPAAVGSGGGRPNLTQGRGHRKQHKPLCSRERAG